MLSQSRGVWQLCSQGFSAGGTLLASCGQPPKVFADWDYYGSIFAIHRLSHMPIFLPFAPISPPRTPPHPFPLTAIRFFYGLIGFRHYFYRFCTILWYLFSGNKSFPNSALWRKKFGNFMNRSRPAASHDW